MLHNKTSNKVYLFNYILKIEKKIYTFIPTGILLKEYSKPSLYTIKFKCFSVQFLRSNALLLWRQEDTRSLRLLSDDRSNFSLRQRLHLLLELLQDELDEMIYEIEQSMLLSLRIQICLLSSVEFLCFAWWNDAT